MRHTFHRPAAQPPKPATKSKPAAVRGQKKPNAHKPPSGRWTFAVPSKITPAKETGWHPDEPEGKGVRWTCNYGCKSFVWTTDPNPGEYHAFDCPYWEHEGKQETPF